MISHYRRNSAFCFEVTEMQLLFRSSVFDRATFDDMIMAEETVVFACNNC